MSNMADTLSGVAMHAAREIKPSWNGGLIAASVAVSLLGAFTSTQLMCQARVSRILLAVVVWTMLASLTFGFCSIWCLHFVAMLACQLDVPIGLDITLTALSAILAMSFTFMTLAGDRIWEKRQRLKQRQAQGRGRGKSKESAQHRAQLRSLTPLGRNSGDMLLDRDQQLDFINENQSASPMMLKTGYHALVNGNGHLSQVRHSPISPYTDAPEFRPGTSDGQISGSPLRQAYDPQRYTRFSLDSGSGRDSETDRSSTSGSRRGSGHSDSDGFSGSEGFTSLQFLKGASAFVGKNPFEVTALTLWAGLTVQNLIKGFVWSLAITLMHYLGIMSMRIPEGYFKLEPLLVLLSAIISWIVCTVGCILMASMETNIGQQLLFSAVASCGVATMHYTGMAATTFYTTSPPVASRGYPDSLPIAIASIAIVTCMAANGLLAHSATIARNKLAEIVRTRRKLWAAIAQKENAEAAAIARSEFIASASHEIRTPLHQLQGYSDLMARCPLPEDARLLLFAIQDATKTLSLITNNVLDWSRLEKGEAVCRPTNVNVRQSCESITKLLPRRDDDLEVELLVVVSPDVPSSLLLDETYLHRIMMNLVSNSLKFTTSGYIMLMVEAEESDLIITVTDTGVGIPTSFLPELFEPFKQAQTRGAERGTGLGLSIVKQLLEKVNGSISTESRHRDTDGIGPMKCGSKFIVRIPLQGSDTSTDTNTLLSKGGNRLAFFENSPTRAIEGFRAAWGKFGIDVFPAKKMSDLTEQTKYAYVDIKMLQQDYNLRQALSNLDDVTVLVPYDTENLLFTVLGSSPPFNFIPIRRPWMFHNIIPTILDASLRPSKADFNHRSVRFATEVDVHSIGTSEPGSEPPSEPPTLPSSPELVNGEANQRSETKMQILLVEDNKINQKLGAKMLKTLGYDVVLAGDGQEAIDILIEKQKSIDVILMDQSMPVKDGLTATKEIREMEATGEITPADKWQHHNVRKRRRPIIAVTAVVGPTHEAMCKAVGTDAFLPKPLSLGKLRETLDEYTQEYDVQDND